MGKGLFMKSIVRLVLIIGTLISTAFASTNDEPLELYWEDLVPKNYEMPPVSMEHTGSMAQVAPNAPLIESLNGQFVKIPGFVVPLEGDADAITEFLLVPYFGACVHVPPPPSNQIVFVKFEEGIPISNLYDAVWVTGQLATDGWVGDIASVGYTMSGYSLEPF